MYFIHSTFHTSLPTSRVETKPKSHSILETMTINQSRVAERNAGRAKEYRNEEGGDWGLGGGEGER